MQSDLAKLEKEIYINCCKSCPFCKRYENYLACVFTGKELETDKIMDWCPLMELQMEELWGDEDAEEE